VSGFAIAFGLSALVALFGAVLLFLRRDTVTRPSLAASARLPG